MTTLALSELSRSARLALNEPDSTAELASRREVQNGSAADRPPELRNRWWQRQAYRYVSRRRRGALAATSLPWDNVEPS